MRASRTVDAVLSRNFEPCTKSVIAPPRTDRRRRLSRRWPVAKCDSFKMGVATVIKTGKTNRSALVDGLERGCVDFQHSALAEHGHREHELGSGVIPAENR